MDCLSNTFLFACLCGLLEVLGKQGPKVGLFVGKDCSFRFALHFLLPLVHHSMGIARPLMMSREDKVRSSELETGLSSSKDRRAFKVTSLSTFYKAWDVRCVLRGKDKGRIKSRFQFPSSVRVRIPSGDDRACCSYDDEVCFYKANFVSDLRFPIHPFLRELFSHLSLAPTQLVPNSWRIVICYMVVWMSVNDEDTIRMDEFLHLYHLRCSRDLGY